jgi:abortive infection bacteriophage resistance protein
MITAYHTGNERFYPGTTFESIWRRYTFDRQLRLLIMDAVEYVEVAILPTTMVEQCTLIHGPFGYCDIQKDHPGFRQSEFDQLIKEVDEGVNRSSEEFVARFQAKYACEPRFPLWMAVEVMTFGQLFTLYRHLNGIEQKQLAKIYNLYPPVLNSWLKTLNYVRNVCAHHGRLWNRELPIRPAIPDLKHHPEFHTPRSIDNRRVYAVLTLLRYLLRIIDKQNDWQFRLEKLLQTYPDIPTHSMGFPTDWKNCPIWK